MNELSDFGYEAFGLEVPCPYGVIGRAAQPPRMPLLSAQDKHRRLEQLDQAARSHPWMTLGVLSYWLTQES